MEITAEDCMDAFLVFLDEEPELAQDLILDAQMGFSAHDECEVLFENLNLEQEIIELACIYIDINNLVLNIKEC